MTQVLVAGIAVLDLVYKVERFPNEAIKYLTHDMQVSLGGCAANAAFAIARLGGEASLAARVGDDQVAEQIIEIMNSAGVDASLVNREPGRRSSISSIFVDAAGERLIMHYRDPDLSTNADWIGAQGINNVGACLADTRWPKAACRLMTLAREHGVAGVLDVEANDDDLVDAYRNASHIAFSADGLRDYTGNPDRFSALRLASRTVRGWVCVTDGADGVFFIDDNELMHVPAFKIDAVDTLGAGDVWHGAFALALARGEKNLEAIYFANAVAAIKCTRFGGTNGTPTNNEAVAFLDQHPRPPLDRVDATGR